jgi:hypothetical protein
MHTAPATAFAARQPIDAALALDLADPVVRRAFNPKRGASGSLTWRQNGVDIADVGFSWSGVTGCLVLTWRQHGSPCRQMVRTIWTTPNFGGRRMWFVCPFSGRRARALFLPNGAAHWASRAAYGLFYTSQRLAPAYRRFATMLARHRRSERRNAMRRQMRKRN